MTASRMSSSLECIPLESERTRPWPAWVASPASRRRQTDSTSMSTASIRTTGLRGTLWPRVRDESEQPRSPLTARLIGPGPPRRLRVGQRSCSAGRCTELGRCESRISPRSHANPPRDTRVPMLSCRVQNWLNLPVNHLPVTIQFRRRPLTGRRALQPLAPASLLSSAGPRAAERCSKSYRANPGEERSTRRCLSTSCS